MHTPLFNLPNEMLIYISKKLDPKSLSMLAKTNTFFLELLSADTVKLYKRSPFILSVIPELKLSFCNNFPPFHISKLCNLSELKIESRIPSLTLNNLKPLKELKILSCLRCVNVIFNKKVFFPKLEKLECFGGTFEGFSSLSKLKSLTVVDCKFQTKSNFVNVFEELKILEILEVYGTHKSIPKIDGHPFFSATLRSCYRRIFR